MLKTNWSALSFRKDYPICVLLALFQADSSTRSLISTHSADKRIEVRFWHAYVHARCIRRNNNKYHPLWALLLPLLVFLYQQLNVV